MIKYFCMPNQEGCGFTCEYCEKENHWVNNYSFMKANDNEYDEHKCVRCGKINKVQQCIGCN